MTRLFLASVVLLMGALLPLQALVNARLGQGIGGPFAAAFISFSVGMMVTALMFLISSGGNPGSLSGLAQQPWWLWVTGGAIGAGVVASAALSVGPLGVASMIALLVCGQMLASVAYDHFGVMRDPIPVDPTRLLGAVLLILGVLLITKPFSR